MRELDQDELIDQWTLVGKEPELVATKHGPAKLADQQVQAVPARGQGDAPMAGTETGADPPDNR
jgi:hypothetical protein